MYLFGFYYTPKPLSCAMLVYAFWEFMGRPVAADFMTHGVEVLLSRARKALRKQLEQEGFVYEEL